MYTLCLKIRARHKAAHPVKSMSSSSSIIIIIIIIISVAEECGVHYEYEYSICTIDSV